MQPRDPLKRSPPAKDDLEKDPMVFGKLVQKVGPCYGLRIIPSPLHLFLKYPVASGPFGIICRVVQGLYGNACIPVRKETDGAIVMKY